MDEPVEGDLLPTRDPPAAVLPEEASVVAVIARSKPIRARKAPATRKLTPFYRKPSSEGPSRSPALVDLSADVIDISDDEEGIYRSLLEKEIDEEEELEKQKGGLQGTLEPVNSSSRAFVLAAHPGPYAGHCPIPRVVSCCHREEYKRFLDSFMGR